jgi:hypothetical protein
MTKRTSKQSAAAAAESRDIDMHVDGEGQAAPSTVTSVTTQATDVASEAGSYDPGTPPDSGKEKAESEDSLIDYNDEKSSDEETLLVATKSKRKTRQESSQPPQTEVEMAVSQDTAVTQDTEPQGAGVLVSDPHA